MKRFFILLSIILLITPCLNAQKNEIVQARSYLKSGEDIDKAEALMRGLLTKPSNKTNIKIYQTLFETVRVQYEQYNENLYLKQKSDTAALFNKCLDMFTVLESLDSIDAAPDKKGNIKIKYRERNAQYLNAYRLNLFYGGAYFMRHQQYQLAFDFYKKYIDCKDQPLFSSYNYLKSDKRMSECAYWATFCGYKLKNPESILLYQDLAVKDSLHNDFVMQYISEAHLMQKDTVKYVNALNAGFKHHPQFPFFFPKLIDYYMSKNRLDSALTIVNNALAVNKSSVVYLYAKSSILLSMGKYKESILISDSLIAKDDSLADSYFNAGTAYISMAVALDNAQGTSTHKSEILNDYKKARKYMERYRELAPDEKDKWAPALYRIYFNLNLGKQFDEIDKIVKSL